MNKEEIIRELQPMFTEAREKNLWFLSSYQNLHFTPDELEEEQKNNKFVWGKVNWTLIDPIEILRKKTIEIEAMVSRAKELRAKIEKGKV